MPANGDVAPLIPPGRFIGIEGVAHMSAGAEAPMLASHREAIERFLRDKGAGMPGRARLFQPVEKARDRVAGLLGLAPADIAFLLNASDGLAAAAAGLHAAAGDNVVVARCEYPSLPLAVLPLAKRGVDVRFAGESPIAEVEDYASCVDPRTRAIFVSHVGHLTGDRADVAALRDLADSVDARLIVDASHSLGAVPVDGALCDAVVSSCYKWLLGVHGCGIFAVNPRRWPDLEPSSLGWHSVIDDDDWRAKDGYRLRSGAAGFETGNPPFLALHVLSNALETLDDVPIGRRAAHIADLGGHLREELVLLGLPVMTPEPTARRAGNISFAADDCGAIETALRASGILVLSGLGRIRISVHVYNGSDDVERCIAALRAMRIGR